MGFLGLTDEVSVDVFAAITGGALNTAKLVWNRADNTDTAKPSLFVLFGVLIVSDLLATL